MAARDVQGFKERLKQLLHEKKFLFVYEIRDEGTRYGLDKSEVAAQLAEFTKKGLGATQVVSAYVSAELADEVGETESASVAPPKTTDRNPLEEAVEKRLREGPYR